MIYERMKYPQDQRNWVRMTDRELPGLISEATRLQGVAAELFKVWEAFTPEQKVKNARSFNVISEVYYDAVRALKQVIYYQGMRRANLPEGQ